MRSKYGSKNNYTAKGDDTTVKKVYFEI